MAYNDLAIAVRSAAEDLQKTEGRDRCRALFFAPGEA
jgi:hypothetical protein